MAALQKIPKDAILGVIEKRGPSQPIDIRKELKAGDSFLIGALLSELVADGALAISKTRRGGAPFYYDVKKPQTLESIAQYLNEKDRRTRELLKESSVLREDAVEPLVRVGLKNIPDFSYPFSITSEGNDVVYWRYFLVSEDDARALILKTQETVNNAATSAPLPVFAADNNLAQQRTPSSPDGSVVSNNLTDNLAESAQTKGAIAGSSLEKEQPSAEKTTVTEALEKNPTTEKPAKKKRAPREKKNVGAPPTAVAPSANSSQDWLMHDTMYERVQQFAVTQKGIITRQESVRPNTELTCVLTTDTTLGKLSTFVIALNKKKVLEKDITKAVLAARGQGMPLLVLSVEPLPAKLPAAFEDTANVYFKRF